MEYYSNDIASRGIRIPARQVRVTLLLSALTFAILAIPAANARYIYTVRAPGLTGTGFAQTGGSPPALTYAAGITNVTPHDFGSVAEGSVGAGSYFTVVNQGTGSLLLGTPTLTGVDAADFTYIPNVAGQTNCAAGATLAPAASCVMGAKFTPQSSGVKEASLNFISDHGVSATEALTGTGVGPTYTAAFAFGNNMIGWWTAVYRGVTTDGYYVRVNNTGTGALSVTGMPEISGTNAGDFIYITVEGETNCVTGLTLPPQANCVLGAKFSPQADGWRAATMTVALSSGVTMTAELSGTGQTAELNVNGSPDIYLGPDRMAVGQQSPVNYAVYQNTASIAQTITSVAITGEDAANFSVQPVPDPYMMYKDCMEGVVLDPWGACRLGIAYQPLAPNQSDMAGYTLTTNLGVTKSGTLFGSSMD